MTPVPTVSVPLGRGTLTLTMLGLVFSQASVIQLVRELANFLSSARAGLTRMASATSATAQTDGKRLMTLFLSATWQPPGVLGARGPWLSVPASRRVWLYRG